MGWKTAKICITIADRNNYARNAREKGVEEECTDTDANADGQMVG